MSDQADKKKPIWFWIIAILAVLWELMGVGSYLYHVTLSAQAMAALPEAQRNLMLATPSWVMGAFAIATFSGLAGAIGLVLRRKWAKPLLILSVVAAIVQFGWVFAVFKAHETLGPSSAVFPAIVVALGLFFVWFATDADRRGWLR